MWLLWNLQNHMQRAYAISVRAREKRTQAFTPWAAVRATEEVEKGNVMFIVGQTQVKGYSFTWSIEWTEFMNCYISLIGNLSSQPKTMAQAWMKLNCNWGDSSSIFVLFFPFFIYMQWHSGVLYKYTTNNCRCNSIIHHLLCGFHGNFLLYKFWWSGKLNVISIFVGLHSRWDNYTIPLFNSAVIVTYSSNPPPTESIDLALHEGQVVAF